jgi:formylglycine-generating enzyme required for sulfatase activity
MANEITIKTETVKALREAIQDLSGATDGRPEKMGAILKILEDACPEEVSALPKMIEIEDRSYSVSETPITVRQYRTFCTETGRDMPAQPGQSGDDFPVVNVTWHEATAYCDWLSQKTGKVVRLPTEDEFEHFAGDHREANPQIAVYGQSSIRPVKTKEPNKYGLYDVLGCVWEWQENPY